MLENYRWQTSKKDLLELWSYSEPLVRLCSTALLVFVLICLYDAYLPAFTLGVNQAGPLAILVFYIGLVTMAQLIYKLLRAIGKTIRA